MEPDRWQRVTAIFEQALGREGAERLAFVKDACAGDADLQFEVEVMLRAHNQAGSFLSASPANPSATAGSKNPALTPGTRLGPYEVTAKIGEGGMGEVYRARDTKLDRDVALKVLPAAFTDDPERLARFEREAKVLASLNHPNIGGIHGLEEADGIRGLALELVEGPTLANRIAQGPIPVDEALSIAKQIAEALEAAHAQGIIHRDLKPVNIKLREDGTVKVLDFGLAKAMNGDGPTGPLEDSPTITAAATVKGVLLGTAAYMSPEQARGKPLDKRSDIWAFGAVLYEMLTGERAFSGDEVTSVLAAVIQADPDWDRLPVALSPTMTTYLRCTLHKDPRRRVHDIADVRLAMEGAFDAAEPRRGNPADRRLRVWQRPATRLAVLVAATGMMAVFGWGFVQPNSNIAPVVRFTLTTPETTPLDIHVATLPDVAISPDGMDIVYRSRSQLMRRSLHELMPTQATTSPAGFAAPFFSPDGQSLGAISGGSSELNIVRLSGGPPTQLRAPSRFRGATWSDDNLIIVGQDIGGLIGVTASGGTFDALTNVDDTAGETSHRWPSMIPGHEAVLFVTTSAEGRPIATSRLAAFDLSTGRVHQLGVAGTMPRYVDTGHVVYATEEGELLAAPFDVDRLEVTSAPVRMVQQVVVKSSGAANFGVSNAGDLVYMTGAPGGGMPRTFVWVDRNGREEPVPAPPRSYHYPRISPDGSRVAVDIADQEQDLWIWNFSSETLTRFTSHPAQDLYPVWSPGGQRLAYSSFRDGRALIFWKAADGRGQVHQLTLAEDEDNYYSPYVWTPDGAGVVSWEVPRGDASHLAVVTTEGESTPLFDTEFAPRNADLSPDGRWLAYDSTETGQREVYVRSFPDAGGAQLISTAGGRSPRWGPDGRELFYLSGSSLVVVPMDTDGEPVATPSVVFEGNYYATAGRTYDIAPDGQRFLMIRDAGQPGSSVPAPQIVVVLNWRHELVEHVPIS